MLRLENGSAGFGVRVVDEGFAVRELLLVPERFDVVGAEPLAPRKRERHLTRTVVFDVALAAHERAHLVSGGVPIGVVRSAARALTPLANTGQCGHGGVGF